MANRRIEWEIALDSAGVQKGIKGIDTELAAMRQRFDDLQKIKAFEGQLAALDDLKKQLQEAEKKSQELAAAAETGGKAAQNAYNRAQAEVDKLSQALKSQSTAAATAAQELEKSGISTKNLAKETERLNKEYAQTVTAVKAAAEVQEAWAAAGVRSTKEVEQELEKLQKLTKSGLLDDRGIKATEKRIEELNKELGKIEPELKAAEKSSDGLAAGIKKMGPAAAAAAAGLLSLDAIISVIKNSIGITADYQDEMQALAALTGANADEMRRLQDETYALAGAAGGPTAIAQGMGDLAAAGAKVSEIIGASGVVRDMSDASRSTLDFAAAGSVLTDILNQYDIPIRNARAATDRMAAAWGGASQNAAELTEGVGKIGGVFVELYGHLGEYDPIEKASAAISVLADLGYKGAEGATILRNAFQRLLAPAGKGADVMAKYADQIKVFAEDGTVRDLPDILDEVAAAQLSVAESFNLWGAEMPQINALIGVGGDRIRDFEAKLKTADGTVAKTSTIMQDGLGGSFRTAGAEIEKASILLIEDFVPAMKDLLSLMEYASPVANALSGTIQGMAAVIKVALDPLLRRMAAIEVILNKIGIVSDFWQRSSGAWFAGALNSAVGAGAAFDRLSNKIGEVAEAQKYLTERSNDVDDAFRAISRATGLTIETMEDLDAAVKAGTLTWDESTATWISNEKEKIAALKQTQEENYAAAQAMAEAEEEGRAAALKAWQDYSKQVLDINKTISQRAADLEAELRGMARSALSAAAAQKELRREAEAAQVQAAEFFAAGDFETAVKVADNARQIWKGLAGDVRKANEELTKTEQQLAETKKRLEELKKSPKVDGIVTEKETEQIKEATEKIKELEAAVKAAQNNVQGQQQALDDSMAGVKKAGELSIEALKQQRDAADAAATALDDAFDFSSAGQAVDEFIQQKIGGISSSSDEAAAGVEASAARMTTAIQAIPDRTITVTVQEVQARAGGGLIQPMLFAAGGSPAFRRPANPYITAGGGQVDDVPALLMRNEYVLRASAVNAADLGGDGLALAHAHNQSNWSAMQAILTKHLATPALSSGPRSGPELGTLRLSIGDVEVETYAGPDAAEAIRSAIAAQQAAADRRAKAIKRAKGRGL